MKILYPYWPVDADYVLVPFEGAQDFEEFSEHFHFVCKLKIAGGRVDGIAVENEDDQCVQSIRSHASQLRSEQ